MVKSFVFGVLCGAEGDMLSLICKLCNCRAKSRYTSGNTENMPFLANDARRGASARHRIDIFVIIPATIQRPP